MKTLIRIYNDPPTNPPTDDIPPIRTGGGTPRR